MRVRFAIWLLLGSVLAVAQQGPTKKPATAATLQNPIPAYEISFKAEEAVSGPAAPTAIVGSPQCSSDGTVMMFFVQAPPARPMDVFYSVSSSREAHVYSIDQVPNFFDARLRSGWYLGESEVLFLVNAATENKEGKDSVVGANGETHEWKANVAEHHDYIAIFDRTGQYKKLVQLDDSFFVSALGEFPGGTFLAYGHDNTTKSPRLGLLKDDGTLIQYLALPDDYVPPDLKQAEEAQKYGAGPSMVLGQFMQFVSSGPNIIVVSVGSRLPLLEVTQAGAVRSIHVELPDHDLVDSVIACDTALYVRPMSAAESPFLDNPAKPKAGKNDVLYQINREDGSILRRLEVVDKAHPHVACVRDNDDFVAFDWSTGKLTPLKGVAELGSHPHVGQ